MHFEYRLCAIFSSHTHLLVLNHWWYVCFLFTLSYFLLVYTHTYAHTFAHSLSRGVKMTREQSQVQCTLHKDLVPLKLQEIVSILFSPVGNRRKGFRSFGEWRRMISFWIAMNVIYLSILFFQTLFVGISHLRKEETEEELSLFCFFTANSWIPPLCCLTETPSELSEKLFWVSLSFSFSSARSLNFNFKALYRHSGFAYGFTKPSTHMRL